MTTDLVLEMHDDSPKMSSREIAELTGKRHDNVRADIEKMASELSLNFQEKSEAPNGGRPMKVYLLPKRESMILVSGYNLQMRAAIIDRWQELEARPAVDPMTALNDPAAMRGLLLSYTEKVIMLETANAELAPKAEALDRISASDGSMTFTQASKVLSIKLVELTRWLNGNGWIYRQNGSWVAFRQHILNGRLEYKESNYTNQTTGMAACKPYCHLTPKGLAKLATVFPCEYGAAA